MRKYLVLLCVLAIVSFGAPNNHADAVSKYDFSMNFVDFSSNELVPVYIRLETEPVVSQLTFDGRYTTSTAEINRPGNMFKTVSLRGVLHEQSTVIGELKDKFSELEVISTSQLLTNRIFAMVPANKIEEIAQYDFVTEVAYHQIPELHRMWSRRPLNCNKVYEGAEDFDGEPCVDPQGRQVNGTGILCSVTDSGLDYTHQDFGSQSKPEGKKVVIARDYAENDGDPQEADGQSHGTACAGIIAGNGSETERGIAWEAKLAAYKIGDSRGRLTGDIARTWEDMILDEVDVSNNSYGHPFGYSSQREAINNAVKAGVCVVASQGNSGSPGPILPIPCGSTGSPANAVAVGATTDWTTKSTMTIVEAPNREYEGKTISGSWGDTGKDFTSYSQPFELVDCGWGRPQDFDGIDIEGKAALIQRGPIDSKYGDPLNHSTKLANAAANGAAMIIYYNHSPGLFIGANFLNPTDQDKWDTFVPAYELSESQGLELREMLHEGHDWELGIPDIKQNMVIVKFGKPEYYGNITDFTSSGPSQYAGLKPDVSAPGDKIWTTAPGNKYTSRFGGTSAAGPFVAGVACLVRQANPEWDGFEVKRALMNTANILRRTTDNNYIPFLSQGMGRVNAFEACTTDILIQPPSTLILTDGNFINSEDSPFEWKDKALKSSLPADIQRSQIAYKVFNYSEDNSHHIEMSYEVNSRQADEIEVIFTSDSIKVPPGSKSNPNYTWVGISIKRPGRLKGGTNDIVIWFTDKKTGQKWHTGICLYSNSPSIQGSRYHYFDYVNISPHEITPNGDGVTDSMNIDFTCTTGSDIAYFGYHENFLTGPSYKVHDYNGNSWHTIKSWSYLELGEYSVEWDGKDDMGMELLPDGEWYTGLDYYVKEVDWSIPALVSTQAQPITFFNSPFQVSNSIVPPLPLITAHPIPNQPGLGNEFEVGIYIEHAENIKSVQFYAVIPGLEDIARYMGYRLGEFMAKDEPLLLPTVDGPDDGSNRIFVDLQRPMDGVSGEGWLLFLRFMPITSNFMDVTFENLNISFINEETWAEEYKFAFYKSSSITIEREFFAETDFNKDGRTDDYDREILVKSLGSRRGDPNFNWRCDLNFDSVIDMNDMAIFASKMD